MKNTNKIVASFTGVVLLIAVVVAVVSFRAFSRVTETAEARKHTFVLLNSANELMSALIDAETGQRGYLLTGDKAFLEPYLAVRSRISVDLKALRQLCLIIAAQKHLDALAPLIEAKLAYLSYNIELRRNDNMTAALASVRGGQGKRLMDSIRTEMSSFIRIEEGALAQRDAQFQSNVRYLFVVIVTTSLLALLFAFLFVYFINRETQYRLKNLVHLETQHLLLIQEETNKQLQQANVTLQISEEKLAVTLNSIGDAVMTTDTEGHVTLLNPLAEQLTGWTQEEATGRPVEEIFHIINEETRQPVTIPVRKTLVDGTTQGLANHTVLIARSGSECAIADSCAPICNRNGQVVGVVLVFRNVTEEYAAREYAESIINTVREPLIALDQDLRVVSASRSFYEAFKVNPKETVGQLVYDLGNKQWDIPKLRELLETILPEKTTFDNYEVEHNFADIGKRIMLLNARQIKRRLGKERIILLAIEDITERKASEEALTKLTKMKSKFTSMVSHELRSPLAVIIGALDIVSEGLTGSVNDEQKEILGIAKGNIDRLGRLINNVLDFQKIESGKMEFDIRENDLNEVLTEVHKSMSILSKKKGLDLRMELEEGLPKIKFDRDKLIQVLTNLVSNAINNAERGSVTLASKKENDVVHIRVQDTGIGIPAEDIPRLFQPFEQMNDSKGRKKGGTGLGLAISKEIILAHQGKIWAESEVGKGSTFQFTLPLKIGSL